MKKKCFSRNDFCWITFYIVYTFSHYIFKSLSKYMNKDMILLFTEVHPSICLWIHTFIR